MSDQKLEVIYIPLSQIHLDDDFNSRGKFSPIDVVDLAKAIDRQGLIQPVTVMPYTEQEYLDTGFKYKLLAGYRRSYAHKVLKKDTIAAIVHARMSDDEALFFNLSENLERKDLTILQEANALKRLKVLGVTEDDCSRRIGKSRGWVQVRYMLLALPVDIQAEVDAGFVNQEQIRELYSIMNKYGMTAVFEATKEIKEAKILGRKNAIMDPKKKNPGTKRHRTRKEIVLLLEHVMSTVGAGLHSRCLAWASGEISTTEVFQDIKVYADSIGKFYSVPTEL